MKTKVMVDMRAAARPNRSGVGIYAAKLIESLAKNYPDIQITGHYFNFLGRHGVGSLPQAQNINYKISRLIPEKAFNLVRRIGLPIPFEFLIKKRANIHVFPDYLMQPSIFGTPAISIIHDLSYVDLPEVVSPRNRADLTKLVPYSITHAKQVVTISKFTKDQINKNYGVNVGKIEIIYPAADLELYNPRPKAEIQKVRSKFNLPEKYILYTGTLEPRKNIEGIVNAYAKLSSNIRKKYTLVLAGGKGWLDERIYQTIAMHQKIGNNIIVTGFVDTEDLPALMSGASLFIFPSFYEGFGMPPLEAMACGVPVVCANTASLPEVVSKAALTVDPDNVGDISKAMERVLTSKKLADELSKKGRAQAKSFSWDKSSHQLYKIIEDLVNEV